jgi:KDO2-lipid IV(A) lauroyltransferase
MDKTDTGTHAGRTAYLAYKSLGAILQVLPRPVASVVASASGLTMSQVWKDRRPIVRANLRRVLGPDASERDLDRAVRKAFDSYAHYWVESARLVTTDPKEVLKRFTIKGFEPVREALDARRGAIMALPHLGSWEIGAYWLTLQGYPMTTVVEPLEPPELFEWFVEQRSTLGLKVVPLGPSSTGELVKTLRHGDLVGLVADRDLTGHGIEVEFFGERTSLPAGPAVLALRTGAPLFPSVAYQRPNGRYEAIILPELRCERGSGSLREDVEAVTAALARSFEGLIRAQPAQWHMFQPNWPSDRGEAT